MPNHAHALISPLQSKKYPLEKIIGSWKQYTAKRINERMGATEELWQDESYDRIVRDGEHLYRSLQNIGRNPEKAGLTRETCLLWVKPEWVVAGWRYEDELQQK
jgi:hypothetical protein